MPRGARGNTTEQLEKLQAAVSGLAAQLHAERAERQVETAALRADVHALTEAFGTQARSTMMSQVERDAFDGVSRSVEPTLAGTDEKRAVSPRRHEDLPMTLAAQSVDDKAETSSHALQASIWDACVLVGADGQEAVGSVWAVMLLFVNVIVQVERPPARARARTHIART